MGLVNCSCPPNMWWDARHALMVVALSFLFAACRDNTVIFNRGNPCPAYTQPAPSPYHSPVWFPNGQIIGFNYAPVKKITYPNSTSCEGFYEFITDSTGFWLMNTDGSNFRRIFPDTLTAPDWSPDGQWLAFSRTIIEPAIFKMRFTGFEFDTTTLVQLAGSGSSLSPTWSPDGQWLAYESNDGDPNGKFGVWKMRTDGSGKRKLSQWGSGEERRPDWSPNGVSITYQRELVGGTVEIFVMDTAGTSSQRLTLDQRINTSPKYAPDGTRIAFLTRGPTGTDDELVRMNSNGSSFPEQIASAVRSPFSWNPIANAICYTSYRLRDYSYNNGTLWIAFLSTGQNQQVTFNEERPSAQ